MVDRNRPPPDKITVEKYSLKNDIGTVEKKSELIVHFTGELLHHGRRAGDEEMTEIRVVSGETNLILHIETYQL